MVVHRSGSIADFVLTVGSREVWNQCFSGQSRDWEGNWRRWTLLCLFCMGFIFCRIRDALRWAGDISDNLSVKSYYRMLISNQLSG